MIKVSIIVPVYNVEKYLRRCLDSLVSQTLQDIEIIVVNDASPDRSDIIMQEYEAKYPSKMKCVYSKINRCQGGARNIGIEMAQGEFLMFVDSDDYVDITICEKLYHMATKYQYDVVYSDYYLANENTGRRHWTSFKYDALLGDIDNEKKLALLLSYYLNVAQIIHRHFFEDGNLRYVEHMKYEDEVFAVKCLLDIKRCGKVPEPLYTYIKRDDSTTGKKNIQNSFDLCKAAHIILDEGKKLAFPESLMTKYAALKVYITCLASLFDFPEPPAESIIAIWEEILENIPELVSSKLLYTIGNENIVNLLQNENPRQFTIAQTAKTSAKVYYTIFYKNIKELLLSVTEQYHNILLWGAGEKGIQFLKHFDNKRDKIKWVADSDSKKWGTILETGHKVFDYRQIIHNVQVVIVTNRNFVSSVEQTVHMCNQEIEIIDIESQIVRDSIHQVLKGKKL